MARISLSISTGLLEMVDEAAEEDFTTRSDIIRAALLWYLRPQGRELKQVDPKVIVETLKRRQAIVEMRKITKDLSPFND